jgi:RNA polymerase sigma-70 factor (ECF subfamily)
VSLSETDRLLLERCLERKPRAWEDFVDRFLGLILHIVDHCARCRSISLNADDREDMAAEVMLEMIRNDMSLLRRFRGGCSLATYLTVIARRIVVRRMLAEAQTHFRTRRLNGSSVEAPDSKYLEKEEVEQLIRRLDSREANIVRMYHLENRSYLEISQVMGVPESSIGPLLSRARAKLRQAPRN